MSVIITGQVEQAELIEQDPYEPDGTKELRGHIRMITDRGMVWFRTPKIVRDGKEYKFPKRGNQFLKVMPTDDGDMLALMVRVGDTITVDGRPKGKNQLNYVSLI